MKKILISCAIILNALTLAAQDKPVILQGLDKKYDVPPTENSKILWNSDGAFGDSANYKELPFHTGRKYYAVFNGKEYYPVKTSIRVSNGASQLGLYASLDPDKTTRYAIYQYAMPQDSDGNVWIYNGNFVLLGSADAEAEMKITVNGKEIKNCTVKGMPRTPLIFEENLGKLKKGDTIQLAVGPKNEAASNNAYKLIYGVEVLPEGQNPTKAFNFVLPAADQPVPPLTYTGETSASYKWSTAQHNAELAKQKPGMILLGDSITAAWRWGNGSCYSKDGTLEGGYTVAAKKLEKYNALGMGLSGDWTNNLIWRLNEYKFDKENPPKIAVVMIGTNNIGNGHSPDQVVAAQKEIVRILRKKILSCKILLIGITPRGGNDLNNPLYAEILKVNSETAKMSDNKNVFYLDLAKAMTAPDGKITTKVFYDGLHLTHFGLNIWADEMIPVVDRILETK